MSSFKDLRVVDNFYQTSLFFPMPTVVISTLCEDGSTSLGPYSLVQPFYVAGKDYYAMLLECRNSSNTCQNVPRVFLPTVLRGCVAWARENNCELITEAEMKIINDKRSKEKNK